jgi:hypothetical protein
MMSDYTYQYSSDSTTSHGPSHRGPSRLQFSEPARASKTEIRRTEYEVLLAMVDETENFLSLSPFRLLILAVEAGAFITFGALLSAFLSLGVESKGPQLLLTALGFISGFFLVVMSGSALFTEVNVSIPAYLLCLGFREREAHSPPTSNIMSPHAQINSGK